MKWSIFRLADDHAVYGDDAGKLVVTTADAQVEITGVVHDEDHAQLIALAPELLASLIELLAVHPCGIRRCPNEKCEARRADELIARVPIALVIPPEKLDAVRALRDGGRIATLDVAPPPTIS